jgi:hypothetical protein
MKKVKNPNTQNLHRFLPITFIFVTPLQRIWNQHKILCLVALYIDLVERIFSVILALFAILSVCLKNWSFSDILQEGKLYCFANRFVLRLNPIEILKKCKIGASLV